MNAIAVRASCIGLSLLMAYSTSAGGFNYIARLTLDEILEAAAQRRPRPAPYSTSPVIMPVRIGSIGRDPAGRGGMWSENELAELARAEQRRAVKFLSKYPERLQANVSPLPLAMYAGTGGPGSPEPGEGFGGAGSGRSFGSWHEVPIGMPPPGWNDDGGGGDDGGPPGSLGGPGGGGSTGDPPGDLKNNLNTNTGNFMTILSLTGWNAPGDSFVDFSIVHNSMMTNEIGAITDIGHSWSHTYSKEIMFYGGGPPATEVAYLLWSDGQRLKFVPSGYPGEFVSTQGYASKLYKFVGGSRVEAKDGWEYHFNSDGYLISEEDPWGNLVTIARNGSDEIIAVTDEVGRSLDFTYNGWGYITSITAPDGKTFNFNHDYSGNLLDVTLPPLDTESHKYEFTYNGSHDILTETTPGGKTWTFTYDMYDRISTSKNPLDKVWNVHYFLDYVTMTDPLGHSVRHDYLDGRLVSIRDEAGFFAHYWSVAGNPRLLAHYKDKNGKDWRWTYGSNGNVLTEKDPLLRVWSYTYDSRNLPETITNPANKTWELDYGNPKLPAPIRIIDPLLRDAEIRIDYDTDGNLIDVMRDFAGGQDEILSAFWYDTYKSNVIKSHVYGPRDSETSATYDVLGRVLTATDAAGETTSVQYDDWSRVVGVEHEDTSEVSVVFDLDSQVLSATDELNRTGYVFYDAAGRVTSVDNAKNETTSFFYDDANRLTDITNARGKTRTYTYTLRSEVYTLLLPDGALETWSYDGVGNTTSYTNPLNQTIEYEYNIALEQTLIDYPTGIDTAFSYDSYGRMTSMTDATGVSSWSYNIAGDITQLVTPQGTIDYAYDTWGRTTSVTEVGVGATTYDWNSVYDVVSSMTNSFGETTSVEFDVFGRVDRKNLPNGTYETLTYDSRSRPLSVVVRNALGSEIERKEYVWDVANRVTDALEGGVWSNYTYDNIDQLVAEAKPSIGYSAAYSFDANGNRTSRTVNGTLETYAYDNADKLLSVSGGSNPRTYAYDAAGRTTGITGVGGTSSFDYDYDGRVTQITYPNLTADAYTYNGAGARASSSGVSGSRTFKRAGLGVTSPVLSDGVAQYTPGVSRRENGVSTFQHSGLKNASAQSSAAGAVSASRVYDAYGNTISSTGTWQGPFGYGGSFGYQEEANGLKLLGHRYYDSDTGRFLNPDPAGSGSNWYAYGDNSPTLSADANGLQTTGLYIEGYVPTWGPPAQARGGGWISFGDISDFFAGWGDSLTMGLTKYPRRFIGQAAGIGDANQAVNYDSGWYLAGELTGTAHSLAMGMGKPAGACFDADTTVILADGSEKRIDEVQVGDDVLTFDEATREITSSSVSRRFVQEAAGLYDLRFADGDQVDATTEHPFYVDGKGWVGAGQLRVGDLIRTSIGEPIELASTDFVAQKVRVYNFEVESTHTYFVGKGKLVHNSCVGVGRRGGAAHRAAVEAAEADAKARGLKHLAGGSLQEKLIRRARRYPDLTFEGEGGKLIFYQIGKVGKRGNPVAREWDAGGDLAEFGEVFYVPYN